MSATSLQPALVLRYGDDYTPQGYPTYKSIPGETQLYQRGDRFFVRDKKRKPNPWVSVDDIVGSHVATLGLARSARDLYTGKETEYAPVKKITCREAFKKIKAKRESMPKGHKMSWTPGTARAQEQRWETFCLPVIGSLEVSRVTIEHIEAIHERMRTLTYEKGGRIYSYAETTIGAVDDTLSVFFNVAKAKPFRYCSANPVELLDEFQRPVESDANEIAVEAIIGPDELELICAAASDRMLYQSGRIMTTLFRLAYRTGLRIGELCGLTWDQVDLASGSILVDRQLLATYKVDDPETWFWGPKGSKDKIGGKNRTVTLFDDERQMMIAYREWLVSTGLLRWGMVFPTSPRSNPIGRSTVQDAFYKAIDQSGIPNGEKRKGTKLHFHCLRDSYASMLFADGHAIERVSELLGHADVKVTTSKYVRILDHVKRHEADRVVDRAARGTAKPASALRLVEGGVA